MDQAPPFFMTPSASRVALWWLLIAPIYVLGQSSADGCFCFPLTYEFVFDFSLTSCPLTGPVGPGIDETSCFIGSSEDVGSSSNSNLEAVWVTNVEVFELNDRLQVLANDFYSQGTFVDGDRFTFTSMASTINARNSSAIPRAIQINLYGSAVDGAGLVNINMIAYTSECNVSPILVSGQQFGWLRLTAMSDPRPDLCPSGGVTASTALPTTASPTTEAPGPSSPSQSSSSSKSQSKKTSESKVSQKSSSSASSSNKSQSKTSSESKVSQKSAFSASRRTEPPTVAPSFVSSPSSSRKSAKRTSSSSKSRGSMRRSMGGSGGAASSATMSSNTRMTMMMSPTMTTSYSRKRTNPPKTYASKKHSKKSLSDFVPKMDILDSRIGPSS